MIDENETDSPGTGSVNGGSGRWRIRRDRRLHRLLLIAVVVLALGMRAFLGFAGLPSYLVFVFFPLLLLVVFWQSATGTSFEKKLGRGILILAFVIAVSVATNVGSVVAGLVLWAALITPFLLIFAVGRSWPALDTAPSLLLVFGSVVVVQALVVVAQAGLFGQRSDSARGFLADQGAGHHVLGLMGAGAAVYASVLILQHADLRRRLWPYAIVVLGVSMIWLTDTRQALLAMAIALTTYVVMRLLRLNAGATVIAALAITALAITAWQAMALPRQATASDFIEFKGMTLALIADEYAANPERALFGLGPGETATRVAWTGAGGTGNLVSSIGLQPGAIAAELRQVEEAKPTTQRSSFSSPWSTFAGVWGDIGIFGLVAYLWLWLLVAKQAKRGPGGDAGVILVAFLITIGIFYNWLEEPALLLVLALAVAASIHSPIPRRVRPGRSTTRAAVRVGPVEDRR